MSTVTYSIPNISCRHCVHTITEELTEVPGVTQVQGDLAMKSVTVTYEPPATADQLEKVLVEINYPPIK